MNKVAIIIILAVLSTLETVAQFAPQQTQYMYNQIAVNPGATGKDDALNITLNYRTMWQGIEGAPKTMYANVHTPLKKEKVSIGLQFFTDQIGVSRRSGVMASGAYRIKMYKSELSFGLGAGAIANQNNWQEVQTVEQGDRVFTQGNTNYWLPTASAGIYYNSKKTFAGISIPQMSSEVYAGGNNYKTSFNPKYYTLQLIGGRWINIDKKNKVLVSSLMRYNRSSKIQPEFSAIYSYNQLFDVGFSVRPKDAVAAIAKFKINEQFGVAYSYDYVIGRLAAYNKGTHEACLLYTFLFKANSPNPKLF